MQCLCLLRRESGYQRGELTRVPKTKEERRDENQQTVTLDANHPLTAQAGQSITNMSHEMKMRMKMASEREERERETTSGGRHEEHQL